MFTRKLGIDLGTATTLVYVPQKGVVAFEPTVICCNKDAKKVLTVGKEAKKMLGRTPGNMIASQPLKDGVIAEYKTTQLILDYFINKATGRLQFLKPSIVISIPAGITSSEKRAVMKAAQKVGVKDTYLVKEPLLAAIGAGLDVNKASGHLIVDIGGGTTEVAVISLGSIVAFKSIKQAGNKMNQDITRYIRKNYNVEVGLETAEKIKKEIGTAIPLESEKSISVQAQDVAKGLPKKIEVNSNKVAKAFYENLHSLSQTLKEVLQETPPELVADVINEGIVLAGGGALLTNLDQYIEQTIGVKCWVAKQPQLCVVKGTGPVLENLEFYKRTLL